MTKVNFYDSIDDSMLKFAVIIAKHNGKWVFCKHRERSTWELELTDLQNDVGWWFNSSKRSVRLVR